MELQNNPVLAAALAPPFDGGNLGEELGGQALRQICRRREEARLSNNQRQHAQGGLGPCDSNEPSQSTIKTTTPWDGKEPSPASMKGAEPRDSKASPQSTIITWPEFVSLFISLGQWEPENWDGGGKEGHRRGKDGGGRGGEEDGTREGKEKEYKELTPLVGVTKGLGEGELQLLRVAFATVAGRGIDDGTVSLTELRAASAELDGEEPPEEPVRKALLQVKIPFTLTLDVCGAYLKNWSVKRSCLNVANFTSSGDTIVQVSIGS